MKTGRQVIEAWLASRLATITYQGSPVEVWRHPAPKHAAYPNITVTSISAMDTRPIGGNTFEERFQYLIRAWDKGTDSTKVNAFAGEILKAIDGVPPYVDTDGDYIVSCRRIGADPIDQLLENGELYQADGGTYSLLVVTRNQSN